MVRFKNRFFVVEINSTSLGEDKNLSFSLHEAVKEAVKSLHGDFGVAAIEFGFLAKYINAATKIAIIRARHGPHRIVASSLPFINKIRFKSATVHTLYTGATMRQCFKFIQSHQRQQLTKMDLKLDQLSSTEVKSKKKAKLQSSYMNISNVFKIK